RRYPGNGPVQRSTERRARGRRPGERRRRQPLDRLPQRLDWLEPRAYGRVPCGGGVADHCATTWQTLAHSIFPAFFGAEESQRDFGEVFGRLAFPCMLAEDRPVTSVRNHPKGRLRNGFVHFQREVYGVQGVPVTVYNQSASGDR